MLGTVAGILTYFAYNGIVFGGIVPVSGAVKRWWSQARWEDEGGYSLTQNLQDIREIPAFNDVNLLAALAICALFPLVWWLARRSRTRQDWLFLVFLCGGFGLAAGHLAKFADTVLFVHPGWAAFTWYFVPGYLMTALLVPLGCFVAIHFLRRFVGSGRGRASSLLSTSVVLVGAVFLFGSTDFDRPFRSVEQASASTSMDWEVTSYAGVRTLDRLLPEGNVLGSADAGVIGYFSRFPVVNLDGVVNSYAFLHRQQDGEGTEALPGKFGITHFANVQSGNKRYDKHTHLHYQHLTLPRVWPEGHPSRAILQGPAPALRVPGDLIFFAHSPLAGAGAGGTAAGAIGHASRHWETLEPHFDSAKDGVGIIVDGRLAQAFLNGCEGEEIREKVFALSWQDAGRAEWAAGNWLPPGNNHVNHPGLCAAALILPKAAFPPFGAETITNSDYVRRLTAAGRRAVSSGFDVYLNENYLIYTREKCSSDDVAANFFLHLVPVDRNDLDTHSRQYGFNNLDFRFEDYAVLTGRECAAIRPLPKYPVNRIRTGQFIPGEGRLWEGEFHLGN